jgi:hypothetical protein
MALTLRAEASATPVPFTRGAADSPSRCFAAASTTAIASAIGRGDAKQHRCLHFVTRRRTTADDRRANNGFFERNGSCRFTAEELLRLMAGRGVKLDGAGVMNRYVIEKISGGV